MNSSIVSAHELGVPGFDDADGLGSFWSELFLIVAALSGACVFVAWRLKPCAALATRGKLALAIDYQTARRAAWIAIHPRPFFYLAPSASIRTMASNTAAGRPNRWPR